MTTSLRFDFKFPKMADEVRRALPMLKRKAMATVQTNRGMLFKHEGANNGHPRWKELASGASQKTDRASGEKQRRILQDSGTLKNSIAPDGANRELPRPGPDGILRFNTDKLEIGTNVRYAKIQNYGGIIRPKTQKYLRWRDENGWHSAKKVKIPKRPFLEGAWNKQDQKELDETMANAIARILGGR